MRPLTRYVTNILHPDLLRGTRVVALLAAALSTPAASFVAEFNSGLPAGTAVCGNSSLIASGGYTNSTCLRLTSNLQIQSAGFVISNDLDSGTPVFTGC